MKSTVAFLLLTLTLGITSHAQSPPPDCTNCLLLNSWYFTNTSWLSYAETSPVNFSNLVNLKGNDGGILLLDTTNTSPAFLFYNVVDTIADPLPTPFTNLITSAGTISLWFSPDWSSSNQGGTGPGNYANLISLGQSGTNGPWWSWFLSPDGDTVYFSSQTNGGSASNYLSAPISLLATNWYNLVLEYSPTNSAFFTNGVLVTNGTGVAYWPGTNTTFFAVGSDTNGYYQARGAFSDLNTYNYQLGSGAIGDYFGLLSILYGVTNNSGGESEVLTDATPIISASDWFSGPGFLNRVSTLSVGANNSNVWLTNVSATLQTNGATKITFTIAGGTNGLYYDVFGIAALTGPITNAIWAWLGQGTNCSIYSINNLTNSAVFLILGTPKDSDGDGLTDAFEILVSHTSTSTANTFGGLPDAWVALNDLAGTNGLASLDPDLDGLNNGQEYLYGTQPLVSEGVAVWVGNPSGFSGIP